MCHSTVHTFGGEGNVCVQAEGLRVFRCVKGYECAWSTRLMSTGCDRTVVFILPPEVRGAVTCAARVAGR